MLLAAEALDRMQSLRAQIDADGEVVRTKNGLKKQHPALKSELAARSFIARTLQRLGLNLEPLQSRPGRPPTPTTWIPPDAG